METVNVIYKYFMGENQDGIIAKGNQLYGTYKHSLDKLPDGSAVICRDILDKLDENPILVHRGSVGVIYTSRYRNKKIGIKIVLPETKEVFEKESSGINFISSLSFLNKKVNDLSSGLTKTMCEETDMSREKKNCIFLRENLLPNNLNIDILKPIDLGNDATFVYEYSDGISFEELVKKQNYSNETKINICKRIIYFVINSMFNKNIHINDPNIGNWLYNEDNNKITYIDYGCIGTSTKDNMKIIHKIFKYLKIKKKIERFLKKYKVNQNLIDIIWDTTRGFFENKLFDFSNVIDLNEENGILKDLVESELPNEIVLFLRSNILLIMVIKKFKITANFTNIVSEILNKFVEKNNKISN